MDVEAMMAMMIESRRAIVEGLAIQRALSAGNDPEPRDVEVELLETTISEDEGMSIPAMHKWLDDQAALVPEECRDSLIVTTSRDGDHDDSWGTLTLTYWRKETPEEIATRLANYALGRQREEDQERGQFERLKAKFDTDHAKERG